MKTILQVNSSLFSGGGQSSRLANEFVDARRAAGATVLLRDLGTDPIPHLTAERFQAFLSKPESRSALEAAVLAQSDALIAELRRADEIVIGLPMYNFGIPSTLKAYFDHIARAGQTFKYTDKGSVGLLTGKNAYVFAARGGLYAGTPADTQTQYVRDFLAFLGITDVEFVYAEGLAINAASRERSLTEARRIIESLNAAETA
ncbi:MAG TPA: NAD(P)H-dependent oxidoreductase [Burkholderiales bacterium]|nr:NAD(P)H-dependent oxidoreductase [Burkholderiales bacterium]